MFFLILDKDITNYQAVHPPSTIRLEPVMYEEASDDRKSITYYSPEQAVNQYLNHYSDLTK